MNVRPIKLVVKKIDVIYRSFIWTGGHKISKKSIVAWKKVCSSNRRCGLNIIALDVWNQITAMKLLWNISRKSDNL